MAYYQGIRFWAQTVASLPLMVYSRLPDGGKALAPDHPMYRVLHDVANPEMTSFTWRETAMGHLIAWGNSFSERQLDGRGRTIALWPLRPDRMVVARNDAGALVYRYTLPFPQGKVIELPASRVFHVRGLSYDGLIGYSPLEIMRRALSLSLTVQEYGDRTFTNDARPGVIYTHPSTLSPKARENLEGSIERNHQGLSNAQRFAVLEEGITVTAIGVPPEDAQYLATRQFQVEEMARGLDLPPHVVGGMDRANFSNIDQQAIDLVVHHVRPMLVRWEAQIGKDLIPETDHFAEFVIDGLLRGDPLIRAQKLWIERQGGAINADEWRALENRNPLPDGAGEAFLQPLNMTPIVTVAEGDQPDFVKPATGLPASGAVPDTTVIPDTKPVKPAAPSKNGRDKVPA
jgi:HK97 family phage portal protein